eukprot:TRINITY_DN5180_c1_g1_i1.p1 TRINITY_DN5180_c1_g1~~TRINITY_DN5180_c1_g1_i1.p1  ORF type:complete len:540 (-),score=115.84 TRINITY_DN5180_c1_g1_i1:96-1715(-)
MGLTGAKPETSPLGDVTQRTGERVGRITVEGRYHRLPKTLEQDYAVEKKTLGTGYNGAVLLARSIQTGQKFAVKAFKLHGVGKTKKDELVNEAEIFLTMDHPHVARLVDVYESETHLHLVMECLDGGELFDRVSERKRFSEEDAASATKQMLLAVNYIHSYGIVHRDLKLENFLYESKESDFLKLIDFGFSKIWEKNTKMELSCGTLSYVAPEVLSKNYTSQCDLWSLGVVVFILLVGYMPFSGSSENEQISAIKHGRYTMKKAKWECVSEQALDFVKRLIVVDPCARLTAEQALAHPWIATCHVARMKNRTSSIDTTIADSLTEYAKGSKFRRACMQLMAWSLTREERAEVRGAFLELDKDRTGKINLIELKAVMEARFHMPEDKSTDVFRALDANADQDISYSEFLGAMMASRIALHDELLHDTFRRFDTENRGYITDSALKQVLGSDVDVQDIMSKVDENNDGQISIDEFIGYLKRQDDDSLDHIERVLDREITQRTVTSNASSWASEDESPVMALVRKRDKFLAWMLPGTKKGVC